MKSVIVIVLIFLVQAPVFGKCLSRQSEVDYYTLGKFNKCSNAELTAGKTKMKGVLQRSKKSKSSHRVAEKALAELSLYGINHELAMRATKIR